MHPTPHTCGACRKFEVSRDPKYGYCKPQMSLSRERDGIVRPCLVDVGRECFMAVWHGDAQRPAFESKKAAP